MNTKLLINQMTFLTIDLNININNNNNNNNNKRRKKTKKKKKEICILRQLLNSFYSKNKY